MRELTTRAHRTVDAPARAFPAYRLDFVHLPDNAVRDLQHTDSGGTGRPGAAYRFGPRATLSLRGGGQRG